MMQTGKSARGVGECNFAGTPLIANHLFTAHKDCKF